MAPFSSTAQRDEANPRCSGQKGTSRVTPAALPRPGHALRPRTRRPAAEPTSRPGPGGWGRAPQDSGPVRDGDSVHEAGRAGGDVALSSQSRPLDCGSNGYPRKLCVNRGLVVDWSRGRWRGGRGGARGRFRLGGAGARERSRWVSGGGCPLGSGASGQGKCEGAPPLSPASPSLAFLLSSGLAPGAAGISLAPGLCFCQVGEVGLRRLGPRGPGRAAGAEAAARLQRAMGRGFPGPVRLLAPRPAGHCVVPGWPRPRPLSLGPALTGPSDERATC